MYTDLTRACPHCVLRVRAWREACPRCQRAELCDAAELTTRWRSLAAAQAPALPYREGVVVAIFVLALVATVVAGAVVFAFLPAGPDPEHVMTVGQFLVGILWCIFLVVGTALGGWVGLGILEAVARTRWRRRAARAPLPCVAVERTDAPSAADVVTGRVVAAGESATSPWSGRACVACRLVGQVGAFEVDDAVAVGFLVETTDGRRGWVDAPSACLALAIEDARPAASASGAARAFLGVRGVAAGADEARLQESVLVVGDEVVLEGALEVVADAPGAGYRGEARLLARDRSTHRVTRRAGASSDAPSAMAG